VAVAIVLTVAMPVYSVDLKTIEATVLPEYFTATMQMVVHRPSGPVKYVFRIYVNRDRALIRFLRPRKRLRILKIKDTYYLYFPNIGKTMVVSGRTIFANSDFKYSDIMDYRLSAYYTVVSHSGRSLLLKGNDDAPYRMVRLHLNDKMEIDTIEYLTEKGRLLKSLRIIKRNETLHYTEEFEMKLAFTGDYRTTVRITQFTAERVH
jgi:outer membrane lipoprotein-sorting protein